MEVEQTQIDPLTVEIRWKRDGRIHREQFCGRTPEEAQKHADERLAELRRP